MELIEFTDFSFQYFSQAQPTLQNINLIIKKGEKVLIAGPSGSGKSTMLNLISGTDWVDAGEIRINGQKMTGMNENQRTLFRREYIGFIFQFFNLIPTLTVIENVTLPLELSGSTINDAERAAIRLLEEVGLEDRLRTFPDRLSGGEQQRVAIARALITAIPTYNNQFVAISGSVMGMGLGVGIGFRANYTCS